MRATELVLVPGPIDKIHTVDCSFAARSSHAQVITSGVAPIVMAALNDGIYPYARQCAYCRPLDRRS